MKNDGSTLQPSKAFAALALLGLFCHPAIQAATPAPVQSRASYEAAFATISTSPAYVLIEVGDGDTAPLHPVCTTANFVLGAIDREYELGSTRDDVLKASQIAMDHADHVFRFHRKAALDNIPARYSEAELAAARSLLAPLSNDEVQAKFSSLYAKDRLPITGYATDAIACALIERGFSPKMTDLSGQVFIER